MNDATLAVSQIAKKLSGAGISKLNYERSKAEKVLDKTTTPNYLKRLLDKYEPAIKEALPEISEPKI